jgi:hypothetical protein
MTASRALLGELAAENQQSGRRNGIRGRGANGGAARGAAARNRTVEAGVEASPSRPQVRLVVPVGVAHHFCRDRGLLLLLRAAGQLRFEAT